MLRNTPIGGRGTLWGVRYLALLLLACGPVSVLPDEDAGADSGSSADASYVFNCLGYWYCLAADGGTDHQRIDLNYCAKTAAAARAELAAMLDGGSWPTDYKGKPCGVSAVCIGDGGVCY